MDVLFDPFVAIEGDVDGQDGRVAVGVDKVGGCLIQVDHEVIALSTCLDKGISNLLDSVVLCNFFMFNLAVCEVEIQEEALVLEESVNIVSLVPNEKVFLLFTRCLDLGDEVWDAKLGPGIGVSSLV